MASSSASIWRKLNITHWDIHFYFDHTNEASVSSANEIRQGLKSTFPSLRVFDMVNRPIGPHPVGMFEAHIVNEQQFGEVVAWLAFNRKDHSVLFHPNASGNGAKGAENDHTIHAVWLGTPLTLDLKIFRRC
eukprot:comp12096_c0_seq1/m.6828 comp12096_c0_seq1/g.6828  ORF comp12096_c0_seq1/g.6828 comp12096_c0_seq1/m.6828 type:complete len:132 (-) comp12096_c0_seq1:506-901(-)